MRQQPACRGAPAARALDAGFQEKRATADGATVNYAEGPNSGPALVLSFSSRARLQPIRRGTRRTATYLVHCIEGKDRTGFACVVLEALCGATYDEILADYMKTYANFYGVTRESDLGKYDAIAGLNLDGMMRFLAHADDNANADLTAIDYSGYARDYLRMGGMTDEQIDALVARLTK